MNCSVLGKVQTLLMNNEGGQNQRDLKRLKVDLRVSHVHGSIGRRSKNLVKIPVYWNITY